MRNKFTKTRVCVIFVYLGVFYQYFRTHMHARGHTHTDARAHTCARVRTQKYMPTPTKVLQKDIRIRQLSDTTYAQRQ